jgi:hypothetical protein
MAQIIFLSFGILSVFVTLHYAAEISTSTTLSTGKYENNFGVSIQCEAGFYCIEGVRAPCPPGSFTTDVGEGSCQLCPSSYYCPTFASNNPSKFRCPIGYSSEEGETSCLPTESFDSTHLIPVRPEVMQVKPVGLTLTPRSTSELVATFSFPAAISLSKFENINPLSSSAKLETEWQHSVLPSRTFVQYVQVFERISSLFEAYPASFLPPFSVLVDFKTLQSYSDWLASTVTLSPSNCGPTLIRGRFYIYLDIVGIWWFRLSSEFTFGEVWAVDSLVVGNSIGLTTNKFHNVTFNLTGPPRWISLEVIAIDGCCATCR